MKDLGTLGGANSRGMGINNKGEVTGAADLAVGDAHAFLYDGKSMEDLGTLGGMVSEGYDINDRGQVTGASQIAGLSQSFFAHDS